MTDATTDATTDDAGRARLEAALAPLGIAYELFPCDPALADTAQFCEAYGFSPDESANTIVVVGRPSLGGTRPASSSRRIASTSTGPSGTSSAHAGVVRRRRDP
jgi:hypothetical protein